MSRKKVEDMVYKFLKELTRDDSNSKRYKEFFSKLNNKEFEQWVLDVSDRSNTETVLYINVPRHGEVDIEVDDIIKLGKKYDMPLFQDIIVKNEDGTTNVLPHKALILKLPVRRASQVIAVQMKAAKSDTVTNKITGAPTGPSASGKWTLPESDILSAYNMDATLNEILKIQGGDVGAYSAFKRLSLLDDKPPTQAEVMQEETGVVVKDTLKSLQRVQYIESNL